MIDGYDDPKLRDLALRQMAYPEIEEIVQAIKSELDANPALWMEPVQRMNIFPHKRRRYFSIDLDDACLF